MFTDDLAQLSSDSISDNRRANAFRRDESGAKWISIHSTAAPTTAGRQDRFWRRKHAQDERGSALRAAFLFHPLKLGRSSEPSRLGKGKGARHVQPYTRSTFLEADDVVVPWEANGFPYNIKARRPKSPPAKLRRRNKNRYR